MSETALEAREPSAKYLAGAEPALVRGFELLATAQGGVSRLRGLIRSLAVQGLLLSQSGAGESANILLDRLGHLKHARVASSRAKAVQPTNDMLARLTGFALPYGWGWASLSELGSFASGKTPSTGKPGYWNGRIPWVTPKDMKASRVIDSEDHISEEAVADGLAIVPESAVLIVVRSGILRRTVPVAIASVLCTVNQDLKALTLYEPAMAAYVQLLISGFEPFILRNLTKIGTTVESIKFDEFAACQFPIPPLAEQHRIVARVEELMKLCDALEQSGRLADEQHARLTSTLFDALAASESAHALAENWQRVAEHFDILLDRLEAINAFEQIGIQLAVRGLLVPQDDGDGSGHDLRKRHLQAVPAGGQRGRTELAPRSDDDAPFLAPDSWAWASFGEVADVSGGVTLGRKGALALPVTLPYLRVANVQRGRLNLTAEVKTVAIDAAELQRFQLKLGDLLITEGGDWDKVGRTCIWRGEIASCLHQNHIFRARGRTSEWLPEWGELYLNSADARSYFAASAKQTTNLASINMTQLRNCAFPLPPIAEQHRIVARVEELRRLCADLRQRLTKARETQSRLADALVAEVA